MADKPNEVNKVRPLPRFYPLLHPCLEDEKQIVNIKNK